MHGEPEPGGRLRVYVGNDSGRIREAQEAIAREKKRHELEKQLAGARQGLASCGYHLRSFYGLLGYTVGEDGRACVHRTI